MSNGGLLLVLSLVASINVGLLLEHKIMVEKLNTESTSAIFGPNEFSDIPSEEFKSTRLMNIDSHQMIIDLELKNAYITNLKTLNDIPSAYDWRNYSVVTPIKNQYSCGSCWSFSTTGNLEGQWALNGNTLTSLSEEFLVDCDNLDCGMFGGWPYNAYEYIIERNGIPSEQDYPYCCGSKETCYPCMAKGYNRTFCGNHDDLYCNRTWDSSHCPTDDWKSATQITDWMPISKNETDIAISLVELGPLSVCMNADMLSHYKSGVYNPNFCDPQGLDHAVLLVGYGTDNSMQPPMDYWIVKNSWGESWGENGYFRIVRGVGKCGINTAVTTSCIGECKSYDIKH